MALHGGLYVAPRHVGRNETDRLELGQRATSALYCEKVDGWTALIDPGVFDVPMLGIHAREKPFWPSRRHDPAEVARRQRLVSAALGRRVHIPGQRRPSD